MVVLIVWLASKLRKAGIFSRVDDSNTSIGKRYARNDELGTPFGVTLDFACECGPDDESATSDVCNWRTAVQNRTMTLRYVYSPVHLQQPQVCLLICIRNSGSATPPDS